MRTKIQWDYDAWEDYLYWQKNDKNVLKRINQLIKDISRNPFEGIGKPESLKENLAEFYNRRIDETNRIVYFVQNDIIYVISCRGRHYDD